MITAIEGVIVRENHPNEDQEGGQDDGQDDGDGDGRAARSRIRQRLGFRTSERFGKSSNLMPRKLRRRLR
jgi:hypothetical protein